MIEQIFYSKSTQKYYTSEAVCEKCGKQIDKQCLYFNSWHRKLKNTRFETYCTSCLTPKTIKSDGVASELKVIFIRSIMEIPKDAFPVFLNAPQLKDGKITSFDIGQMDSDITIDNTKYAGRESFNGAMIGADVKDKIKKLDSNVDVDYFLSDLKESKPIVPKQIEVDKQ